MYDNYSVLLPYINQMAPLKISENLVFYNICVYTETVAELHLSLALDKTVLKDLYLIIQLDKYFNSVLILFLLGFAVQIFESPHKWLGELLSVGTFYN